MSRFWRGFRRGYIQANLILLPPFTVDVIGHYAGWWR